MQTSDRRHSIFYLHLTDEGESTSDEKRSLTNDILGLSEKLGTQASKLELLLPKLLGPNYRYMIEKGVRSFEPIKYEKRHMNCFKNFVYYTSRLGIVFNPIKNKQEFYEGHKLKISAIALHPKKSIIATGEVNVNPDIHIWNPQTLETLAILNTTHRGGILHLTFSGDGSKVISCGIDDANSIQVFHWEQQRCIAFKNTGKLPIFSLKADPYDLNKFMTCGYQHIAQWTLTGNHLTCSNFIHIENEYAEEEQKEERKIADPEEKEKIVFMCMDFICHRMGYGIESDVYIGSSKGTISCYTSEKHIFLNKKAHDGIINCIRVTDMASINKSATNVIT